MTDTLTRLAGPTSPSRSDAGSTIYDPSTGTIAVKNAIFSNRDPNKGAWGYLSLGALTTPGNILVPGLYVPPLTEIVVPLDLVMDGTVDDIRARQVVDMSQSIMSAALAVAAVASTTDGTSIATGSWTAANPRAYLLFGVSTHASAAAKPSSITDTHTGVTWTQIGTEITNAAGTMCAFAYRAQSSGTTNTTTTLNFGATMTGFHVVIFDVTGADTGGSNGSEAFQDGGTFRGSATTQTAFTVLGNAILGARAALVTSNAGGTSTPGSGFTELSDGAIATPTNMATTEYAFTAGGSADVTLGTTSTDKIGVLVGMQDGSTPLNVTLNGVVTT